MPFLIDISSLCPFGLEPLDPEPFGCELRVERLTAERFSRGAQPSGDKALKPCLRKLDGYDKSIEYGQRSNDKY